ncbi:MAG: flagellar basal body P-ring protein FlgI [Planctomycetota bacterium]
MRTTPVQTSCPAAVRRRSFGRVDLIVALIAGPAAAGVASAQDPPASAPTALPATEAAPAATGATPAPAVPPSSAVFVRLQQITRLHNSQPNMLEGTGLVVGLNATGSGDVVSRQALQNYIRSHGLNVRESDVVTGAVALVTVTAELPAFSCEGMTIDATVSNLGDASSLFGGNLLQCELRAVDGTVYALASGPVIVGGFSAAGKTAKVTRNHTTVGHVAGGARVVQDLPSSFLSAAGDLELQLLHPNQSTVTNIATRVQEVVATLGCSARPNGISMLRITLPPQKQTEAFALEVLNRISDLPVPVHNPSTVVINEASGLVLAGEGVMISPCTIALEDLTISVAQEDEVVQPLPGFNQGQTAIVPRTQIDVTTTKNDFKPLRGGATVAELLENLKALELTPRQLVVVFQKLADNGYLQAELKVD